MKKPFKLNLEQESYIRDQFAMAALTAIASHEKNIVAIAQNDVCSLEIARDCYFMADAMLKAREE